MALSMAVQLKDEGAANLLDLALRLRRPKLLRPRRRAQPKISPASVQTAAKVEAKPLSDVLAGALARAGSQSTIHPLDTIKVKMQAGAQAAKGAAGGAAKQAARATSKFSKLVPPLGAMKKVDRKSVIRNVGSLYSGVGGAACGAGIAIGAYFAVYGAATNAILRITKDNKNVSAATVAFMAGAIAAAGSSVIKVPLAVCIRSVQAGVYPNVMTAGRSIIRQAGVRGLFTGFVPTLLEDVPDMAVKFAVYEIMREAHAKVFLRPSNTQEDLIIGGVAGSVAAATTTPLDVVKTRMMCAASSRPSIMSAAGSVLREGKGVSAFFTGIYPRAISNGINTAVFFCFFEALRGAFKEHKARQAAREQAQAVQGALAFHAEGIQPVGASLSKAHSQGMRRRPSA